MLAEVIGGTVMAIMQVTIHDAEKCLAELIRAARRGEQVVIVGPDGPVQLSAMTPTVAAGPKPGFAKGTFEMSDDFDEPLADFEPYAP